MAIFGKGSKLYSAFSMRCPKCHEGKMFYTPTFSFKRPFDMKERCDTCNADFFPEPGYYYGAMFISYIFTAFFCIGFALFFHWVLGWSTEASFALLLLILAIMFVFIFRLSRTLYINLNESYDPNAIANNAGRTNQKATGSRFGGRK